MTFEEAQAAAVEAVRKIDPAQHGIRCEARGDLWDVYLSDPEADLMDEFHDALVVALGDSFGKLRELS